MTVARKTVITLIDDIDGDLAGETVVFAIDGTSYEIDLTDKRAAKLREALAPFAAAGRRVTGVARRGARRGASRPDRERSGQIRQWARERNIHVSERGRIAAGVVEQYEADESTR